MKLIVIPPCPRCGAPRPWRDGFYTTRSGEKRLRLRCRVCGYAHVRRPWYETTYRVGSPYRRRADAVLRRQAEAQRVLGEFARSVQAEPTGTIHEFFLSVQAVIAPLYREFQAVLQAVCPRCKGLETVRDGHIRGKPRRRCRACGCRYVAEARWRRVRPSSIAGSMETGLSVGQARPPSLSSLSGG